MSEEDLDEIIKETVESQHDYPQLSVTCTNPLTNDIQVRISEQMSKYIDWIQEKHKIKSRADTVRYILACGLAGKCPISRGDDFKYTYSNALLERSNHYVVVE